MSNDIPAPGRLTAEQEAAIHKLVALASIPAVTGVPVSSWSDDYAKDISLLLAEIEVLRDERDDYEKRCEAWCDVYREAQRAERDEAQALAHSTTEILHTANAHRNMVIDLKQACAHVQAELTVSNADRDLLRTALTKCRDYLHSVNGFAIPSQAQLPGILAQQADAALQGIPVPVQGIPVPGNVGDGRVRRGTQAASKHAFSASERAEEHAEESILIQAQHLAELEATRQVTNRFWIERIIECWGEPNRVLVENDPLRWLYGLVEDPALRDELQAALRKQRQKHALPDSPPQVGNQEACLSWEEANPDAP